MSDLEAYVTRLRENRFAGVPETSNYPAIKELLDSVGAKLKPKVVCVLHPRGQKEGLPDAGLFTAGQLKERDDTGLLLTLPERGAVEIKPLSDDAETAAKGGQVFAYLREHNQVLVSNFREFLWVERDDLGAARIVETYALAASEDEFWERTSQPRKFSAEHAERLQLFLERVLLSRTSLTSPQQVARFLASYARDAKSRLEGLEDLESLDALRQSLEEALGMKFEGERGQHFFRSTLVQTLFYGVFSAWVLWHEERPARTDTFDWHSASYYLHVPMIQSLFHQVSSPRELGRLGLTDVLGLAGDLLARVDRGAFFAVFEAGEAVQYFYEPFLEAFDPELRKQLGVWYTPREIVRYMVERVDAVLRTELAIPDGLADERVVVLDPCCGTGAYLVEALKKIGDTLRKRGEGAAAVGLVKNAAAKRVFGFELLPAPYVVAHLQLGLLLHQMGTPLQRAERVCVYLTNALTGWEPPEGAHKRLPYPELEEERDAAEKVKRDTRILVVLGNPPYNGFAGVAVDESRELTDAYRTTADPGTPKPQGQGLNDLYVRFYRLAERQIVERNDPSAGVVCFISNYSWLDGLSFTGMRERYLKVFDRIWIDNLHGDRKITEYAPDGRTSETVMAIRGQSPGIKVGTAIALLVRTPDHSSNGAELLYRDMDEARADERRAALISSLQDDDPNKRYIQVNPPVRLGLPAKPLVVRNGYLDWPLLPAVMQSWFPGVKTSRDNLLIDIDRDRLEKRIRAYFDPQVTHEDMRRLSEASMSQVGRSEPTIVRDELRRRGMQANAIVHHAYRPFDVRWMYWESTGRLLDRPRPDYRPHVFRGNVWLGAQQKPRRVWSRPQVVREIASLDLMDRGASCFPLLLNGVAQSAGLFDDPHGEDAAERHNLSGDARDYLKKLELWPQDADAVFYHALATMHSPLYARENAGALRQDWPRLPLSSEPESVLASAALGRRIAGLFDVDMPVVGVTATPISSQMRDLAVISSSDGKALDEAKGDFAVTAGWGHRGQGDVTMPGSGRLVESNDGVRVFLNDRVYLDNIPRNVWDYTLGGYQVLKKWLSYREESVLGRPMRLDEVRLFRDIARRIAVLLALGPELDESYRRCRDSAIALNGS